MRVSEIVSPEQQRLAAIKQQAKSAQKRAKEAAARLKLQQAQSQLHKLSTGSK